jgi:outer membrane protein assembly factor BamD
VFARMVVVAFLAVSFLGPAAKSEETSRAPQNAASGPSNDIAAGEATKQGAEHELEIGRYYVKRKDYVGAINRFKVVVTRFPSSPVVDEALFGLVQAYSLLGILNEAQTAAAVLDRKFPDSHWRADALEVLEKSGSQPAENEKSWISRAFQ